MKDTSSGGHEPPSEVRGDPVVLRTSVVKKFSEAVTVLKAWERE